MREPQDFEVIVYVRSLATMQCSTYMARPTIAVVADSSDVLMLRVDEENVGATAEPLRTAL
jgi:hypothetical protein